MSINESGFLKKQGTLTSHGGDREPLECSESMALKKSGQYNESENYIETAYYSEAAKEKKTWCYNELHPPAKIVHKNKPS